MEDDDGRALVDAVADTFETPDSALTTASDNEDRLDVMLQTADDGTETGRIADIESQPSGVGDLENVQTDITQNSDDITVLDGRVATNEEDLDAAWMDPYGTERGVDAQHEDLAAAACDGTGVLNVANCADARSRHNEATLEDHDMKLQQKKAYIDKLAAQVGVDPVTGDGTEANGMSRIDNDETRSMDNAVAIEKETMDRMAGDEALGMRIDTEVSDRTAATRHWACRSTRRRQHEPQRIWV